MGFTSFIPQFEVVKFINSVLISMSVVYVTEFWKTSIYAQQYFCNKTHVKTMGKKCKLKKKNVQVSIASLVDELNRQWIHPGHHRVHLSMGSTKIFVSSPCTNRFQSYRRLFTLR